MHLYEALIKNPAPEQLVPFLLSLCIYHQRVRPINGNLYQQH